MRKLLFAFIAIFSFTFSSAQDTLDVMFYNIYRYPSATPSQREFLLRDIFDAKIPDIFMVCELESESGADRILNTSFANTRANYKRATFVSNQSDSTDLLQQMVYFNSDKFSLIDQKVYVTTVRDINRYTLLLHTTDLEQDSVIFELFVAHLKSSTGTANATLRYNMTDTFVQALAQIPTSSNVLFAGDFNLYRSTELAYMHLVDTLNRSHLMVDPIYTTGSWQDKPEFASVHTQSTRTSAQGFGMFGATGGVDDRFDFIFMSKQLEDTTRSVYYLEDSYVAFGNNGNCLNKAINNDSCSGLYSASLRQSLHDMSDHLPVRMQLVTTKTLGAPPIDTATSIPSYNRNVEFSILGSNLVYNELNVLVKYPNYPPVNSKLKIMDVMGEIVQIASISKAYEVLKLDVSSLTSGIYFIHLDGARKPIKFVKP